MNAREALQRLQLLQQAKYEAHNDRQAQKLNDPNRSSILVAPGVVQQLGGDLRPVSSQTNGAIGLGSPVLVRNQNFFDGRATVRPPAVEVTESSTPTIKYLFRAVENGVTGYYIGGHKATPVNVTDKIPVNLSDYTGFGFLLNNRSGNAWSVDMALGKTNLAQAAIFDSTGYQWLSQEFAISPTVSGLGGVYFRQNGFFVVTVDGVSTSRGVNYYYVYLFDERTKPSSLDVVLIPNEDFSNALIRSQGDEPIAVTGIGILGNPWYPCVVSKAGTKGAGVKSVGKLPDPQINTTLWCDGQTVNEYNIDPFPVFGFGGRVDVFESAITQTPSIGSVLTATNRTEITVQYLSTSFEQTKTQKVKVYPPGSQFSSVTILSYSYSE